VERAFAALRSGDPEEARQLAATAYQTIEASQGGDPQLTEQMLVALAIQDPVKYHADLARVADPLSFQRLREVALLMPEQLDQQQTEAMRKLLMRISFGLAPGQRH
jgi:mannose/cellobiose epimerase-like protein (N-acyl-D-glucosamine 2-epimerase family)